MPCVDNKRMLHMHMASVERCPASSTVSVFCCCHKQPHHSVSLSTRVLVTNSMQCHDTAQCTLGWPTSDSVLHTIGGHILDGILQGHSICVSGNKTPFVETSSQ